MISSISNIEIKEIILAKKLFKMGFLPGPRLCSCGANYFLIKNDNSYAINKWSFRCGNYKCRKKYPITVNSFYSLFQKQKLSLLYEIIKFFICYEYNTKKTYEYINNNYDVFVGKNIITKIYKQIRSIICKYMKIS